MINSRLVWKPNFIVFLLNLFGMSLGKRGSIGLLLIIFGGLIYLLKSIFFYGSYGLMGSLLMIDLLNV